MERLLRVIGAGTIIFGCALAILISCTPGGRALGNLYEGELQKVDDLTNYETRKKVEDSCRAMVVSYESDKLMYEQYKESESSEERSWAAAAKIRANKTALMYNEYVLKNKYVWSGNIPEDIKTELEVIK